MNPAGLNTQEMINTFRTLRILVVGDAMLDSYFIGQVDRISPEAPVPVISVTQKDHRPGGAANVALNLIHLGARATLCSVIGEDADGRELTDILSGHGIDISGVIKEKSRPTTVKTRVIASRHHLLRIDHETTKPIKKSTESRLLDFIAGRLDQTDAIILQDYNKGVLTKHLIEGVIRMANERGIPTVVDPKKEHFFTYKHCTLFKPNRKEIREGLKTDRDLKDLNQVREAARELRDRLDCTHVMVTLSEDGAMILDQKEIIHVPAHPRNIVDVSGAGDSVVSVAALCLAAGMDMNRVVRLSNLAGGMVCERVGVVPVTLEDLVGEIAKTGIV